MFLSRRFRRIFSLHPQSMRTTFFGPLEYVIGLVTVTSETSSRRFAEGTAGIDAPTPIEPIMVPWVRKRFVSARVSTDVRPGTPSFVNHCERLENAFQ